MFSNKITEHYLLSHIDYKPVYTAKRLSPIRIPFHADSTKANLTVYKNTNTLKLWHTALNGST